MLTHINIKFQYLNSFLSMSILYSWISIHSHR